MTPDLVRSLDSAASKQLLNYILTKKVGDLHTFDCRCYHVGGTCNTHKKWKIIRVIIALLKINLPIHILPLVFFKFN